MKMDTAVKKRMINVILYVLVCAAFLVCGMKVSAKRIDRETSSKELSTLAKTPYIKDRSVIVLRFQDFAKRGYDYTLTNLKTKENHKGKIRSGIGIFSFDLKKYGLYSEGTGYKLVLRTKSGKKQCTTRYYTASALKDIEVSQLKDNSLEYRWKLTNNKAYTGFLAMATRKKNPVMPEIRTMVANGQGKLDSKKFSSGTYTVSAIAYRLIGGYRYYGERIAKVLEYEKTPGRVTGLQVKEGANSASLRWNPVDGAVSYRVYAKKPGGKYHLKGDQVKATSYKVTGLKANAKYIFCVRAVMGFGSDLKLGAMSLEDSVKIPNAAPDIRRIVPTLNKNNELSIKWKEVTNARAYWVYARKTGTENYTLLGKTKDTIFSLKDLNRQTSYDIVAYAVSKVDGKKYKSPNGSNVITLTPAEYVKTHRQQLLASTVRTIKYHHYSCEYTSKRYSREVKEAYVNYKGFESKTRYLIWVSRYTQQTTIYKGSKGKWKQIRTFVVGTGKATSTTPKGVFKIFRKERGWYYNSTQCLYISHFRSRNSFHTRPLYYGGAVATHTIGRPVSHGCVRCYTPDAWFIYKKIPLQTTVVIF